MIDPRIRIIQSKRSGWNKQSGEYTQWCAFMMEDAYIDKAGFQFIVGKNAVTVTEICSDKIIFDNGSELQKGGTVEITETTNPGKSNEEFYILKLYWDPSTPRKNKDGNVASDMFSENELSRVANYFLSISWNTFFKELRKNVEEWFPGSPILKAGIEIHRLKPGFKKEASVFDWKDYGIKETSEVEICLKAINKKGSYMKIYFDDELEKMDQTFSHDFEKWMKEAPAVPTVIALFPRIKIGKPYNESGVKLFEKYLCEHFFSIEIQPGI